MLGPLVTGLAKHEEKRIIFLRKFIFCECNTPKKKQHNVKEDDKTKQLSDLEQKDSASAGIT